MITGYFSVCKDKISVKRTIRVTTFYGFFCGMIGILQIVKEGFSIDSIKNIFRCFLSPVMGGCWWFVTAYVLLALISTTVNKYLMKIDSAELLLVIVAFWFFEYTVGNVTTNQYFQIQRALMFYLIGVYLRKRGTLLGKKICCIGFTLTYCLNVIAQYLSDTAIAGGKNGITNEIVVLGSSCLINSIFVIIEAACLFELFLQINIVSEKIVTIGRSVFGIYLLHDSPFTRNIIWHDIVKIENLYVMKIYPILALLVIVCVFLSCYIFEKIRYVYVEKPMERVFYKCHLHIRCFVNNIREKRNNRI